MKAVLTLALLSGAFAFAQGAEPPKIVAGDAPKVVAVDDVPAAKWTELKGKAGKPTTLKADRPVFWVLVDDSLAALIVPDAAKPSDTAKLVPYGAGAHRVVSYDPADPTNPVRIVVLIGDVPNPMPPTPPAPVPPADPLTAKLQEAFRTDSPADPTARINSAKDLAAMYKVLADDMAKTDAERISDVVKTAAQNSNDMVKGQLPGCRAVFRDELKKLYPTDAVLTDDLKKTLSDTFSRFQAAALTLPTAPTK